MVFSTALDQIPPWSIKIILDMMTEGAPMMKLLHPLVFMAGAVLISCALTYFQRQWVIQSSRKMEYEIRNDLYKDLQRQPKIFYNTISVGEIMSHATNDLDRIRDLLGPVVLHLVRIVCLAAYTFVCIWLLSPRLLFLGLVPAIILPLFFYIL